MGFLYDSNQTSNKCFTQSSPLSSLLYNFRNPITILHWCFNICPSCVLFPLQLELQSCCVFLPNDSLPSPTTIICGDIPGTVRSWYHNQASMPGTLVVCLPQISVFSAGHKYMEPLQELPFVVSKPILEEGMFFSLSQTKSQLKMIGF